MIPTVLCWFSCARDYPMLAHSVAAARAVFPGAPAVVFLDQAERVLPEIDGVEIRRTEFARGPNLQSVEAPAGVAGALLDAAREFDEASVVKIDSDTLVLGRSWAAPVVDRHWAISAGWRMTTRPGLGAAYAIAADALTAVVDSFDTVPPASMEEDREILGRVALWARWTGRRTAMEVLDADPSLNTLRQFRREMAFDSTAQAVHFGRVKDAAQHMQAVRRQYAERLQAGGN
jgi:hypothetical protein